MRFRTGRASLPACLCFECRELSGCQSGVWKKGSLGLSGKDAQSGSVAAVLSYNGLDPGDGMTYYCKSYTETLEASGLVIFNIQTAGISQIPKVSQLAALVAIDGRTLSSNYDIAQETGGFSVSASASDTLSAGSHSLQICAAGKSVSSWTATYAVSVLK